jgi:hypothetical protein
MGQRSLIVNTKRGVRFPREQPADTLQPSCWRGWHRGQQRFPDLDGQVLCTCVAFGNGEPHVRVSDCLREEDSEIGGLFDAHR